MFIDENLKFIVNKIDLFVLGEKIFVKVDFKIDKGNFFEGVKGILYFWGKIFYDKEFNNLKVVELDYDVDIKNVLILRVNLFLKFVLLK